MRAYMNSLSIFPRSTPSGSASSGAVRLKGEALSDLELAKSLPGSAALGEAALDDAIVAVLLESSKLIAPAPRAKPALIRFGSACRRPSAMTRPAVLRGLPRCAPGPLMSSSSESTLALRLRFDSLRPPEAGGC